jgi:hypothetical protein
MHIIATNIDTGIRTAYPFAACVIHADIPRHQAMAQQLHAEAVKETREIEQLLAGLKGDQVDAHAMDMTQRMLRSNREQVAKLERFCRRVASAEAVLITPAGDEVCVRDLAFVASTKDERDLMAATLRTVHPDAVKPT